VPTALSAFVGRARDLAGVGELLGRARLVTLAGPGGVGKTRLAREAAVRGAAVADGTPPFPDGVWWVELAPLPPGADPAAAVAGALGVRQSGSDSRSDAQVETQVDPQVDTPVDALVAALADRRLLLVLDNCEHVVDGAAALADLLLRRCPGLTVLATSREALGVEGEVVWPVGGWRTRRSGRRTTRPARCRGTLGRGGGRRLRGGRAVRRARARRAAGLRAHRAHGAHVAAICARLDGLPLALELAAAQVGTLGVEQLATRLDDVFAVLTRGRRTALPRHRTLPALLDWSYHLLAPPSARSSRASVCSGAPSRSSTPSSCARRPMAWTPAARAAPPT
jgi:predicted ATPase